MKFFAFALASVGLFQANCQSSIGGPQGNDSLQEEPLNLIKNGNFEFPSITGNYKYVDFVSDWDAPQRIKLSKGEVSNSNWGNRYVIELVTSGGKNAYLRQTLNLRRGIYILTFEYAPRKGKASSSPMALVWNGRVIENFYPSDESVRVFAAELIATNGNNSLEFRAIGKEDLYSMAISNVQIVPSTLLLYFNPTSRNLDWTGFNGGSLVSVPYTPGALQSIGSNSVPEGLGTLVSNNNFASVPNEFVQLFNQNSILTHGGELPGEFSTWFHSIDYFGNSNDGLFLGNAGTNNLQGSNTNNVNSILSTNLDGVLGSGVNGNFNPLNPLLNGNLNSNFQNVGTGIDANGNLGQIVDTNSYIVAGDPSLTPAVISGARYQDLINGGTLIHNGLSDETTTVLNKITNGRFIYPSIVYSTYRRLTSISHWEVTDVIIYVGYRHNKNWGNRFVLELAALPRSNGHIRQTLTLESGTYILTFDYAAREKKVDTSGLLVVWNGQEIKDVNAFDEIVRTMRLEVSAFNGQNTLEIRSIGFADYYTMAVADIRLVPKITP